MAKTSLLQSGDIGEILGRERDVETPGFLQTGNVGQEFDGGFDEDSFNAPQLESNNKRQMDFIKRLLQSNSLDQFPGRKAFRQSQRTRGREQVTPEALTPTDLLRKEAVGRLLTMEEESAVFGRRTSTEERSFRRERYKDSTDQRKAKSYFDWYLRLQAMGLQIATAKSDALSGERQWKFADNFLKQMTQEGEINEQKKELETQATSLMVKRATDTTRPLSERLLALTDGSALPGNPATGGAYADMIKKGEITSDHMRTLKVNGTKALEVIDGFFQEKVPKDIEENGILEFWTASDFYDKETGRKFPTKAQWEIGQGRLKEFRKAWSASKNPQATFRNLVQRLLDDPETETTAIEQEFGMVFTEAAVQAAKELAPVYRARDTITGRIDLIEDMNDETDPKVKQTLQDMTTAEEGLDDGDLFAQIKNEVIGADGKPNWDKVDEIIRREMERVKIGGASNEVMGLPVDSIGSLWETLGFTGLHDQNQSYFEPLAVSQALGAGERFPRSLAEGARLGVLAEPGRHEIQRLVKRGREARVKTVKKDIVRKLIGGVALDEDDREIIRQYRGKKAFEKAQGDLSIDEMFDNEILKMFPQEEPAPAKPKITGPPLPSP